MSVNDIDIREGAVHFAHTRKYDNLKQYAMNGPNGFGWECMQLPKTEFHAGYYYRTTFAGDDTVNFNLQPDSTGVYRAEAGFPDTMRIDTTNKTFVITRSDLTVWTFSNNPNGTVPQGLPVTVVKTDGSATKYVYSNGKLVKIQAYLTSAPSDILAELVYSYDSNGRVAQILRNAKANNSLQAEKRVAYTYHTGSDSFGNSGDLKTATTEVYQNGAWGGAATYYYRYYKGESKGKVHALKMAFFPSDFVLLAAALGNPNYQSVSDTNALNYSTKYYEYDNSERVVLERVERNRKVISFTYTNYSDNTNVNKVHRKTVESGPYGNKSIIFTNYQGNVLLREDVPPVSSNEPSSIQYFQYNEDGQRTHDYSPKTVLNYSVQQGTPTSLSVSLASNDGKIEIREYGNGTTVPKNQVVRELIQKGSNGTSIVLRSYQYTKRQIDNRVAWKKASVTEYVDETGTNSVTTQFAYQYHNNSLQVSQKTTTFSAVSTANNGNGVAATRIERFDEDGRLIWQKDELGIITYYQYEPIRGLRTKTIQDVNTSKTSDFTVSVPAGWSTVSGAGKHLVTEFEYDLLGRLTQALGPQNTSVNASNQSISTRTASWTAYDDINRKVTRASGYATLNSSGTITGYTLINPVAITIQDSSGNVIEQIQAKRASTTGKLLATDTFAQSSYIAWSKNIYTGSDMTASRQYFNIPASGDGTKNTHYLETNYSYDNYGRHNQATSPDGTITKNTLDWRNLVTMTEIGTNSSNMVPVTEIIYGGEGECAICTGQQANPRLVIQHVDTSTTRITEYGYDWRGRHIHVHGEEDADGNSTYSLITYDNLNRITKNERFLAIQTGTDRLLARAEQFYDERGRVWKQVQSIVNPTNGAVAGKMQSLTWYDAADHTIKSLGLGENHFTKTFYDSLGRATKPFVCYDAGDTSYATATTVTGDTVFEQSVMTYDNVGNVILAASAKRKVNQNATGELTLSTARFQNVANWYDPVGRLIASANYGTNGDTALTRPATVPTRSDNILVTENIYDTNTGQAFCTIDPAGKDHRSFFDAMNRTVKTIANYTGSGAVSSSTPDQNVTVEMTYHPSGLVATMTAKNATTGDQITRYVYGTSKTSAAPVIYRNDLLTAEIYPDSDDLENSSGILQNGTDNVADRVELQYNRIGERIWRKDQNGSIHTYDFDNLGRVLHDRVTTLASGVDSTVRRISTTYNIVGQISAITSYNNATVGSGSVVNEIKYEYDTNSLLAKEYLNPSGSATTSSKYVGYSYDATKSGEFFTKGLRPTSMRYPSATMINYVYGTSGSVDDKLNRFTAVQNGSTNVATYMDMGLATPAVVKYPVPNLTLDYTASGALDRFGRIADHAWKNSSGAALAQIKHGYDRIGNRLYREDVAAGNASKSFDELYVYDGMNQLKDMPAW